MRHARWRGAATAIGPQSRQTALVVTKNGDDGLAYYLHAQEFNKRFFPDGARVREIDTLSKISTISPPKRPFRLVEQRGLAPCCVLRRFRSPHSVPIRPSDIAGARLHESQKVLLDGVPRVIVAGHQSGPPAD